MSEGWDRKEGMLEREVIFMNQGFFYSLFSIYFLFLFMHVHIIQQHYALRVLASLAWCVFLLYYFLIFFMAWWIKRTLMKNTICNSDVEEQCWLYLVTASGCDHGQNGNGSSYHFYAKDVAFFSFYAAVSCVFRLYRLCLSTCPEGVLLQPWSKGLLSSLFLFYFILFMYIYFWFPIKVSILLLSTLYHTGLEYVCLKIIK